MTERLLKIGAVIGAAVVSLFAVMAMFSASGSTATQAAAPTPTPMSVTVSTNAVVSGTAGTTNPAVLAAWALPDMQPGDSMQYCANPSTDLNTNLICDGDDNPLLTGMQMYPNLCDNPVERKVQYWAVATDPTGIGAITAIFAKVYQPGRDSGATTCPDGSAVDPNGYCFKYQVDEATTHAQLLPCSAIGTFDDSGPTNVLTLSDAMKAAVDTGQISEANAENLVIECSKNEAVVAMGENTIAHGEPAGIYLVDTTVLDVGGQGDLTTSFTVLPIVGLMIDFTTVDWGTIKANIPNWVSGDADLTTPAKPTVKDCGNIDLAIGLNFSKMLQQGVSGPKEIDSFDAYLLGQTIDPITQGVPVWFNKCLIPCHPKELDLSIEPPSLLPQGTYKGTLTVLSTACTE